MSVSRAGSAEAEPRSASQSGTGTEEASQSPPPSSHGSESQVGSGPKPGSSSDNGADGDGAETWTGCSVAETGRTGSAASRGASCWTTGRGAAGWETGGTASCSVAAIGAVPCPGSPGAGALEGVGAVCCCGADSAGPWVTAGSGRRSTFGPEPPAGADPPAAMANSTFTPSTLLTLCPRIATFSCRAVNAVSAPVCAKLTVNVRPSNPVTEALGATIIQTNFLLLLSSSRMSGHARRNISTDPVPPEVPAGAWPCCGPWPCCGA